jgi:hypothetical protein
MTLRGAAKRHGVPIKSIRTLIKNYRIGVAQMGKYGTVRIAEMDALQAKLELCDKLNADRTCVPCRYPSVGSGNSRNPPMSSLIPPNKLMQVAAPSSMPFPLEYRLLPALTVHLCF